MAIKLEDVWKTYKNGETETHALKEVNLEIKKGEYVAIYGPSGSGKSTFLHVAGLLDVPTKGKVIVSGKDVSKLNDEELSETRGKNIGFVFQAFNLIPTLTALENVMLPMMIYEYDEKDRKEIATEILERLGLGNRLGNKPNQLSGGQKQRVAIARALSLNPLFILADEPTGNLDSKSGEEVIKIFRELNKEGRTIITVTHDKEIAKEAHRTVQIRDGKIEKEVIK